MTIVGKKTTVLGSAFLLMLVASGKEARAQRTMRGENLISVGVHYPFSTPYWMGVDFSYGLSEFRNRLHCDLGHRRGGKRTALHHQVHDRTV